MPNTFLRKLSRNVGTSPATVGSYTVAAATQTTVIGLTCSNNTATAITVDVALNDGANDHFMVKTTTVPSGGSLVVVGGDQKVVMQTGDSIKITSSAASSCDVIMSLLEIT